jgi:nucleolar protein 15
MVKKGGFYKEKNMAKKAADIKEKLVPKDLKEESQQENTNVKVSRRTEKIDSLIESTNLNTGVLYISHLPWGTNEDLIKKYFEQFGTMTRYILPRSRISGRIKGFAFIEYENIQIANIAAKTMNNFILFNKILKCEVLTDKSKYNTMFKNWKRQFVFHNRYKKFVESRNKKKSIKDTKTAVEFYLEKENKKREKLKSLGINYDFPGFKKALELNKPSKK